MRLDVNLASRPSVNRTPPAVLLAVLGTVAVAFTAWNLLLFLDARSEVRAAEAQLSELEGSERELSRRGEALRARLAAEDFRALDVQVRAADTVLSQRSLSWSLLLDRLEEVIPWDAALSSVSTSVGKEGVEMSLDFRARNQEYYLELIDALERSPCFANVYPDGDARTVSGEFEASVTLDHDPDCGTRPKADDRPRRATRAPARRASGGRRG